MATQTDLPVSDDTPPTSSAPVSPLAAEVAGLRALQANDDHAGALSGAIRLLEGEPTNRDLLLIAAHSLRMTQRTDEAFAMLDRLAQHHPQFSQLFLERGLCHVARRDAPAADRLVDCGIGDAAMARIGSDRNSHPSIRLNR